MAPSFGSWWTTEIEIKRVCKGNSPYQEFLLSGQPFAIAEVVLKTLSQIANWSSEAAELMQKRGNNLKASRRPSRSAGIYRSVLPLSWSISTVDSTNAENCCVKTSSENLINEKDELTDLISDN